MTYQKPKGTRDISGRELRRIETVCREARVFFGRHGYQEIRTPTFESADLFARSIGPGTDIVEKEMYSFVHDDKTFVLRPEGTASVLRAVIENQLPLPGRYLYIANMFRKEKPQKGRYREFLQIGVELLGEAKPYYDAELILQARDFLSLIGAGDITIEINSIGCPRCRTAYRDLLTKALTGSFEQLCADCRRRFDKNFLRIFDCKVEACRAIYRTLPAITDHLCVECAEHYQRVKFYLDALSVPYRENKGLVRGLDYYVRTVFEFKSAGLGAQDTILAGGRYDRLMQELGGGEAPSIGWAMGVERMLIAMPEDRPKIEEPKVFMVAAMGVPALSKAITLDRMIRDLGCVCYVGNPDDSLKQQLKKADRLAVDHAIILGEEELKEGYLTVRDMKQSEQKKITEAEFEKFLNEIQTDRSDR